MDAKFIIDDYMLIWNLLFQASISENILKLKQKLWENYKKKYNDAYNDKLLILEDYKNFIPNDDTIYNFLLENKYYEKIKKQVEKYRLDVMKLWDKNKKEINNLIVNVLRKDIGEYTFFVVDKETSIVEHASNNSFIIGKAIDRDKPFSLLYEIHMQIFNHKIKDYDGNNKAFKKAIIEFAVLNEFATNLTGKSHYLFGSPELLSLKRWLYPYWLMYLGVPKNEFKERMTRDNIYFDDTKYAYEKELKKMNIEQFIDFCIRNQRYIVRENK